MAVAITRPAGGRVDDVRALRQRLRTLTFSGNYATGGETVTAASLGLKRIMAVHSANGSVLPGATPATGNPWSAIISASGTSCVIRLYELGGTGAAQDPLIEKDNAEAYIAGQNATFMFVGF